MKDKTNVKRARARELAAEFLKQGKPLDWFEALYQENVSSGTVIPWADLVPNPHLVSWVKKQNPNLKGKKALKIGCGLGDDAEYLASLGCRVTAFDIAPTAIAQCKKRFPTSSVDYQVRDLFSPPSSWIGQFDFVLETYTVQALPIELHEDAMKAISSYLSKEGILLVICRGRDEQEKVEQVPWPLTKKELQYFCDAGLREIVFEDYIDNEDPPIRRFRAEYRR